MKRAFWGLMTAGLLVLAHSNCASRIREANSGRSAEEVSEMMASLSTAANGTSSDLQAALDLVKNDPESTVYFSEAPGGMGPLEAVVPLDFQYVTGSQHGIGNLDSVRAFFIDSQQDDGYHKNALILQYRVKGESTYNVTVFTNFISNSGELGDLVDGEFTSVLRSSSQTNALLYVRSLDRDPEDENLLAAVIQLELAALDNDGNESGNLGQISSMEGFSIFF